MDTESGLDGGAARFQSGALHGGGLPDADAGGGPGGPVLRLRALGGKAFGIPGGQFAAPGVPPDHRRRPPAADGRHVHPDGRPGPVRHGNLPEPLKSCKKIGYQA